MTAYYNENDPKAAAWIRELIKHNLIAPGEVDERSIKDVKPSDLKGFKQCHFFAGVGGWSYALRLANWPGDREVWTGSCPCQPWSSAGKVQGSADDRHLWPAFRWLIGQRKPSIVFGEQVTSGYGPKWLAGIRSDLETMSYQFGASDLCSASVGSPNIRQRLWWVASGNSGVVHSNIERFNQARKSVSGSGQCVSRAGHIGGMGNALLEGRERESLGQLGATNQSYWAKFDVIECLDEKNRRFEPGSFPLAHGIPERVGLLRGYGNAINPWVAKIFIEATMT